MELKIFTVGEGIADAHIFSRRPARIVGHIARKVRPFILYRGRGRDEIFLDRGAVNKEGLDRGGGEPSHHADRRMVRLDGVIFRRAHKEGDIAFRVRTLEDALQSWVIGGIDAKGSEIGGARPREEVGKFVIDEGEVGILLSLFGGGRGQRFRKGIGIFALVDIALFLHEGEDEVSPCEALLFIFERGISIGRAHESGQHGTFRNGKLPRRLAEIEGRGVSDAERAVPEVDGVEIQFKDLLLRVDFLEGASELEFLEFSCQRLFACEVGVFDELLADC